jgi:hypothetical protein
VHRLACAGVRVGVGDEPDRATAVGRADHGRQERMSAAGQLHADVGAHRRDLFERPEQFGQPPDLNGYCGAHGGRRQRAPDPIGELTGRVE